MKKTLPIIIVVLIIAGFGTAWRLTKEDTTSPIYPKACTQEAKLCPDGSYVGRTGPNCEFTLCPTTDPTPTPKPNSVSYNSDGSCPSGYVNYGIPLQCVTPEYNEYCNSNPCPICLAKNTLIDTPLGAIPVEDLEKGAPIWTVNTLGKRVQGVVIETSKTSVPLTHTMVRLVLADGRTLLASPGHPTARGRTVGDIRAGDVYDDIRVISSDRVLYDDEYTYDILSSGETGFYFANGILLGSTLR